MAEIYLSGEHPETYTPGDFLLTDHPSTFWGRLIQFGQSIRFTNQDKYFASFTHAAIIVDENGGLIEATPQGVIKTHINKYTTSPYVIIHPDIAESDRGQVVRCAEHALGARYGVMKFISLGLGFLTGLRFSFGIDGELVCSGLVAKCLERTDALFHRESANMTPADLAKYYDVVIEREA